MTPSSYTPLLEGTKLSLVTNLVPVNSVILFDGNIVVVDKAVESDGSSTTEGFAMKTSTTGAHIASWRSNVASDDASNAVPIKPWA